MVVCYYIVPLGFLFLWEVLVAFAEFVVQNIKLGFVESYLQLLIDGFTGNDHLVVCPGLDGEHRSRLVCKHKQYSLIYSLT